MKTTITNRQAVDMYEALKALDGNHKVRTREGAEQWQPDIPKRRRHFVPSVDSAIITNIRRLEPLVTELNSTRQELARAHDFGSGESFDGERFNAFRLEEEQEMTAMVEVDLRQAPTSALNTSKVTTVKRVPVAILLGPVLTDDWPQEEGVATELTNDELRTLYYEAASWDDPVAWEEKEGDVKPKLFTFKEDAVIGLIRSLAAMRPLVVAFECAMDMTRVTLNPKNLDENQMDGESKKKLWDAQAKLEEAKSTVTLYPVDLTDLQLEKNEHLSRSRVGTLLERLVIER